MTSYSNGIDLSGFEEAQEELMTVIGEVLALGGVGEHGDVEKLLSLRVREVGRLVMQGFFDRLAGKEAKREDVRGPQGVVLRYPRERTRRLETIFGPIWVRRLGYRDHGTGSVFPLDAQTNLPPGRYSHGLQELAAEAAAQGSYDAAVGRIHSLTSGRFPKRQLEEMVQDFARDFDGYYGQRPITVARSWQPNEDLLILSVDGKGIVMRYEDLREETKRRAEGASHKLAKRLSRGEKRNRKRMATVATVYEVAAHDRSAEEIIQKSHRSKQAPRPSNKRVWASVKKTPAEVLDDALEEVKRRDPQGQRTLVVLVDGQEEQLRQLEAALKRHERQAMVIQDVFHVSEYVWDAAWCFHKEGDPAAQKWVDERLVEILRGKSSDVGAGMCRSATRRELSQSARAPVDRCANYLKKNRERLAYATALEIGAPVGTGVVEGACRHLVKARMECSGARWSLDGAESVLRLRALQMSDDWSAYCAFHQTRERLRNYPEPSPEQRMAA